MKEDRIKNIWDHPIFQKIERELAEWEKERTFCRHGVEHLLDVARIATLLVYEAHMEKEYPKDVIYGAALLHDIGKSRQYEEGIPHESAGEALAAQILADMPKDIAYTEAEKQQILTAILGHRRLRDNPEPLESLLYQGDKLSRACFACPSQAECNWSIEKKNMEIRL